MPVIILLVEPHASQRQSIADFLALHLPGVTVVPVASSEQALTHWQQAHLIILAQRLAPFDGLTVIRHIRETNVTVPIVMHTADYSVEHAALAAGSTCFLRKGSLHELLDAVRPLLGATVENCR